jgi:hypothetical protein
MVVPSFSTQLLSRDDIPIRAFTLRTDPRVIDPRDPPMAAACTNFIFRKHHLYTILIGITYLYIRPCFWVVFCVKYLFCAKTLISRRSGKSEIRGPGPS